jgi:cation:H+ antiporter
LRQRHRPDTFGTGGNAEGAAGERMEHPHPHVAPIHETPESLHLFWLLIAGTVLVGAPGLVLRLAGVELAPALGSLVFGLAILAAAFLLGWAAETAEIDISAGLALAIIALITVLPEYAVSFVLAYDAGSDPAVAAQGLAIANMTGGNRLLIGVGWPIVFWLFYLRSRRSQLAVDRHRSLELAFLTVATLYGISLPLRDTITLMDAAVLITIFVIYMFFTTRQEAEEAELVGPAKAMGVLPDTRRRVVVAALLIFSAAVILASAEPFADSLVELGEQAGVSEFLLVQWLAPLASESPEILVAGALAWRARASLGMGALISSKVNQWTLLIGTLPIAFALASGHWSLTSGLPLDSREREELFVTGAQSAFAIAVFLNLRMGAREALALFLLFATQLFITNEQVRIVYGMLYSLLCLVLLVLNWKDARITAGTAWDIIRGRK